MDKELLTIIIAPMIVGAIWYYQDYKRKQKEKQQERLNQIQWYIIYYYTWEYFL